MVWARGAPRESRIVSGPERVEAALRRHRDRPEGAGAWMGAFDRVDLKQTPKLYNWA
jgi:hypothetical protein